MQTLSIRDLQLNAGSLTIADCPIVITKYKKPLFVLESSETMNTLYELSDYDVKSLHRELELLRAFIRRKLGISPAQAIADEQYVRESSEEAPVVSEPTKVGTKSDELMAMLSQTADDQFKKII